MFACCIAAPAADAPPLPTEGPASFTVKSAGMFSKHYNILTPEGDSWMQIKNNSGFFDPECNFSLVPSGSTDILGDLSKCEVGAQDIKMDKSLEWEGDSNDSDFSVDDLFDLIDDDDELKVKLKWKVKREATFYDESENPFAKLQFKVKGKSKAEIEIDGETNEERTSSKTKVKKVFYTLTVGEEEVTLNFENGKWDDWQRVWECSKFKCEYNSNWGTDTVSVDTAEGVPPCSALLVAFAISYFFHPANYADKMESKAMSECRSYISRFRE